VCFAALLLGAACGKSSTAVQSTTPSASPAVTPQPASDSSSLHFTVSPMDVASIIYITPLGAMAPSGHTLPTDHGYFYHSMGPGPIAPVSVYAPAGGVVTTNSNGRIDVRVNSVYSYWLGPLVFASGITTGVTVEAGTLLGSHATAPAFDFSVMRTTQSLNLINPLRYSPETLQADGFIQYFDEPVRSAIVAKVLRTGSQLDGRIDYDVAGTLAGNWFAEDLPVQDSGKGGDLFVGTRKLAFARDVFSPDHQRVSIGGLGMTGLYATPDGDTDFASVTAGSGLVVYRMLHVGEPQSPTSDLQIGWLLVQVQDAQHLRVEAVPLPSTVPMADAGAAPTAFSANAATYLR